MDINIVNYNKVCFSFNNLTCPCISPHTVTGVDTGCTLDSSNRSSLTRSHNFCKENYINDVNTGSSYAM